MQSKSSINNKKKKLAKVGQLSFIAVFNVFITFSHPFSCILCSFINLRERERVRELILMFNFAFKSSFIFFNALQNYLDVII